jgi:hypothetical protein
MRGPDITQEPLLSICQTADFVPTTHPLRAIREILNLALRDMDRLFESMYEHRARDSVPPEWLLREKRNLPRLKNGGFTLAVVNTAPSFFN